MKRVSRCQKRLEPAGNRDRHNRVSVYFTSMRNRNASKGQRSFLHTITYTHLGRRVTYQTQTWRWQPSPSLRWTSLPLRASKRSSSQSVASGVRASCRSSTCCDSSPLCDLEMLVLTLGQTGVRTLEPAPRPTITDLDVVQICSLL